MEITFDYYTNLSSYMDSINNHYNSINNNYNKFIFQENNLPPEIINLILEYLPLKSLIFSGLSCKRFLLTTIDIIKNGNIFISEHSDFIKLFYTKPKSVLMNLIHENINTLYYDNSKNYMQILPKNNINILPKLKKLILCVEFVDQLNVIKLTKNIDIVINVCNNNKCSICLVSDIYKELIRINKSFKLYHNKKLYN